eukprot:jgi/Bigna1/146197/aug1.110_g20905
MSNTMESLHWGLSQSNPWTSIWMRHPGDYMLSFKRITILLTILFNSLTIASLLEGQKQTLPLLGSSVYSSAIIAFLFAFPIPFVLGMFFRRIRPHDFRVHIETPKSAGYCICVLACLLLLMDDSGAAMDGEGGGAEELMEEVEEGIEEDEDGEDDDDDDDDGNDENLVDGGEVKASNGAEKAAVKLGVAAGAVTGNEMGAAHKPHNKKQDKKKAKRNSIRQGRNTMQQKSIIDLLGSEVKHAPEVKKSVSETIKEYIKANPELDNLSYYYRDIFGIVFCLIVCSGCWFVVAILAFVARNKTDGWVEASLLSYLTDVASRVTRIFIISSLWYFPAIGVLFVALGCRVGSRDGKDTTLVLRSFEMGILGFRVKNLTVDKILLESTSSTIKVGWKVVKVMGKKVESDSEFSHEVHKAQRAFHRVELSFDPSNGQGPFTPNVYNTPDQANASTQSTQYRMISKKKTPALSIDVVDEIELAELARRSMQESSIRINETVHGTEQGILTLHRSDSIDAAQRNSNFPLRRTSSYMVERQDVKGQITTTAQENDLKAFRI